MIKKKRYGETLKEQLIAGARDRLVAFSLSDGQVRGSMVQGTRLVNEMRANHQLDILQTMVLGRVYLAAPYSSNPSIPSKEIPHVTKFE